MKISEMEINDLLLIKKSILEIKNLVDKFERKIRDLSIDLIDNPISFLELTVRTNNCLRHEGIKTVKDLLEKRERDLRKIPNLGERSIKDIQQMLANHNLRLDK